MSAPDHSKTSEAVLGLQSVIATALVGRESGLTPASRPGAENLSQEQMLQEASDHVLFLAQALTLNNPAVFTDYVAWAKVLQSRSHRPASSLALQLSDLAELLRERLPGEPGSMAAGYVTRAVTAMPEMPEDLPTFLHEGQPLSPLAHQYFEALRRGERHLASRLVLDAVAAGTPVKEIYLHVFQPAQYEIGRLWQTNRITVAQEHYCTAATQLIMSQLYPHVFATAKNGLTLVAACVASDLHEIGVRMVSDFFEMDGWNTFYLGANTPHASVIATIIERQAQILAVSATISYHVEEVRNLIRTVRADPVAGKVKILVGGYPFNRDPDLWRKVGADGSAADAQQAIMLAHQLMPEARL